VLAPSEHVHAHTEMQRDLRGEMCAAAEAVEAEPAADWHGGRKECAVSDDAGA
jgi:hypothetical protein